MQIRTYIDSEREAQPELKRVALDAALNGGNVEVGQFKV